jgi:hypothetical protein
MRTGPRTTLRPHHSSPGHPPPPLDAPAPPSQRVCQARPRAAHPHAADWPHPPRDAVHVWEGEGAAQDPRQPARDLPGGAQAGGGAGPGACAVARPRRPGPRQRCVAPSSRPPRCYHGPLSSPTATPPLLPPTPWPLPPPLPPGPARLRRACLRLPRRPALPPAAGALRLQVRAGASGRGQRAGAECGSAGWQVAGRGAAAQPRLRLTPAAAVPADTPCPSLLPSPQPVPQAHRGQDGRRVPGAE